jgi:hypothetical protein
LHNIDPQLRPGSHTAVLLVCQEVVEHMSL